MRPLAAAVVAALVAASVVARLVQEAHVARPHVERVTGIAVAIRVFTQLHRALDVGIGPLVQVLANPLGLLAEDADPEPRRHIAGLAALGRGDGELGDRIAAR